MTTQGKKQKHLQREKYYVGLSLLEEMPFICDEDEMIELIEQRVLAETTEKQMNYKVGGGVANGIFR